MGEQRGGAGGRSAGRWGTSMAAGEEDRGKGCCGEEGETGARRRRRDEGDGEGVQPGGEAGSGARWVSPPPATRQPEDEGEDEAAAIGDRHEGAEAEERRGRRKWRGWDWAAAVARRRARRRMRRSSGRRGSGATGGRRTERRGGGNGGEEEASGARREGERNGQESRSGEAEERKTKE